MYSFEPLLPFIRCIGMTRSTTCLGAWCDSLKVLEFYHAFPLSHFNCFLVLSVPCGRTAIVRRGSKREALTYVDKNGFLVGKRSELHASQVYPPGFSRSLGGLVLFCSGRASRARQTGV
eukprot:3033668-Pyramimonas_sp.AAC.1